MQTVGAGSSLSEQNGGIEVAASLARSGEVPDRVEPKADNQQQMAAMNLFRLFCCGGRDAGEWTADDMRLVDTHVVPELFGRHARISWSTPRIALDELQRLIFDNPMPAHVWHALDNAETDPIRGGLHGGSVADSMQQRPSVRAAKAQPKLGITQSGSSISTGVKMLQRLGSSDGLTPKASRSRCSRTRAVPHVRPNSSAPQNRSKSMTQLASLPIWLPKQEEQISRLERQVSQKEVGVKQWLTSLRAEMFKDGAAEQ